MNRMIEIIKKEGTPTYIFDINELTIRVQKIKEILGDNISLCYSIKANPFLTYELSRILDKLEVCSPGELDICKRIKDRNEDFQMNKIVYSGVSKTYENISDAYICGVGEYTAESVQQLERINKIANENGEILPVLLRLSSGTQFGMAKKDIEYIVKNRNDLFKNIEIEGIHYFVGTQRKGKESEKQKKDINELVIFYNEIYEKYGLKFKKLEYGPGLPVNLFKSEMDNDSFLPLLDIAGALKKLTENIEVTVEMGRFLVTYCGYYITRLMETKCTDDINYAILDGGINHVNYYGQIMGMNTPIIHHFSADGIEITGESEEWRMCGSLCTVNDYLVKCFKTEKMQVGDYFVFSNIGAYSITEGIYLFLSRTMPKVILIKDSIDYIVARDFYESSKLNDLTQSK